MSNRSWSDAALEALMPTARKWNATLVAGHIARALGRLEEAEVDDSGKAFVTFQVDGLWFEVAVRELD